MATFTRSEPWKRSFHPVVRARWLAEAQEAKLAGKPFVADIPLLFETGSEAQFDRIITVGCSVETQLARLCAREP